VLCGHAHWLSCFLAAYASGGAIPVAVRNTTVTGLISLVDWYTTFALLAGVSPVDERAAAANLPPVDGLDVVSYLLRLFHDVSSSHNLTKRGCSGH
jgi:arylsulfatase A-like enzyme